MISKESEVARQVHYQQWAQDVRDCNSRPEGITVKQWCTQRGINESTYYWRLRALRAAYLEAFASNDTDAPSEQPGVHFIELKPPADSLSDLELEASRANPVAASIRIGNAAVELNESVSDAFLLRIMEAASHVK